MDENRPEKFTFYEIYATIIDGMKDEEAGRMIRRICSYMFGNGEIEEITDKRERYLWGNIAEELRETKEKELVGKTPKTLNKRMRHFTFPNNFYEAIELMDDRQSGAYIKAICRYMFRDEEPEKLPSPVDTYYMLARRKLGAEKERKKAGRKNGTVRDKEISVTKNSKPRAEDLTEKNTDERTQKYPSFEPPEGMPQESKASFGQREFAELYPEIRNNLYGEGKRLAEGIDWELLAEKLPESGYAESKDLYRILKHYREIIGK